EVADRLRVSPGLVYEWVEGGELPHYRMGAGGKRGAIRVDEADLDSFVAGMKKERRRETPPPVRKTAPLKLKHLQV
ncbi:MAG TPA: helix-turn-helix domain-containing protein, partial [Gemmataceae bacterium]|nr:helix-turn-helix domain-containing protein [Gemmataceae bacterium]